MIVVRTWHQVSLQPHRLEWYLRSTDPECETKAADVIGSYLEPPQHVVAFCVDGKTANQALDRLDPVLPLPPGRAARRGFESYRPGTLLLHAALNTRTGDVVGPTAAWPTRAELVRLLQAVVETQPRRREPPSIVDDWLAYRTRRVRTFLVARPYVHLHCTPTNSSWLTQVEPSLKSNSSSPRSNATPWPRFASSEPHQAL